LERRCQRHSSEGAQARRCGLDRIAAPCVLVAGTEEDPHGTQDEMAARIPHGRSVHLAGVGHVGAFLRPDEVVAAALPALREAAG